jgi:hypothetical protein
MSAQARTKSTASAKNATTIKKHEISHGDVLPRAIAPRWPP